MVDLGQWQHVAATFDVASGDLRIYVNGAEVSTTLIESGSPATIFDRASPVRIGAAGDGNGRLVSFWNGLIDNVELYDRALSSSEIHDLYAAGTAGPCGSVTILPATPTISLSPITVVFDGSPHVPVATASGIDGAAVSGTFDFAYDPGGASAPLNAGRYVVSATFVSRDAN